MSTSDNNQPLPKEGLTLGAWLIRQNSTPYPDRYPGLFSVNHEGYRFVPDNIHLPMRVTESWDKVANIEFGNHEIKLYKPEQRYHHFQIFAPGITRLNAPTGLSAVVAYFRHVQARGKTIPTYAQIKEAVKIDLDATSAKKGCLVFMPIVLGASAGAVWLLGTLLS